VKQGKGGKAAVAVGEVAQDVVEEELLTLDPAELELPPGVKTDSECDGVVVWW
jgi:hypothetical protein